MTGDTKITMSWMDSHYQESLPEDAGSRGIAGFRQLMREYSKIPDEEIDDHLYKIRDQAWQVVKYPCIGRWSWLSLRHLRDTRAKEVISRLKAPFSTDVMLDVGCCLGETIRALVNAGVKPTKLYGTDLHPEFISIGYDLFRDRDTLSSVFVAGNMLSQDDDNNNLSLLYGKATIIHASNFFHLFSWDQQVAVAERMVRFLKQSKLPCLKTPPLIFGRQIGTLSPRRLQRGGANGLRYLHDRASFQKLWDEVGELTGTQWRVEMEVIGEIPFKFPWLEPEIRYTSFGVYKVERSWC